MQTTFGFEEQPRIVVARAGDPAIPHVTPAHLPEWCIGLPALTVRQPWATAIVYFGKCVENRKWGGHYLDMQLHQARQAGSRFLIHAAKGLDEDDITGWRNHIHERPKCRPSEAQLAAAGVKMLCDLPRGGIVGVARFVEWVTMHDSPWFVGPGALVLRDVTPLPFAPCRGQQGFFKPHF